MDKKSIKIQAHNSNKVNLKIVPGHFATSHSHVNYYLDMTTMKTRQSEAMEIARVMAMQYVNNVIVDTIICMDECEVIGAFLAQELTKSGILSMNEHKTIYIISPEFITNGQMIFRENTLPAVNGKHILLLVASVTTGKTVRKCLECINYYGGKIQGVSAIFSTIPEIEHITVNSIFTGKDIPEYKNYNINNCPFCKEKQKIEAIINGYGYVKL